MPGVKVPSRNGPEADLLGTTTLTEDLVLQASTSNRLGPESLERFSLTQKGLSRIGDLSSFSRLLELDLTGNRISRITGLDQLSRLQKLVLASNRLASVDGLSQLAALEHLLLQDNCLTSLADLNLQQLANLPRLQSLYFQNPGGAQANSACRLPGYRESVLAALPALRNLDGERQPAPAPPGTRRPPSAAPAAQPPKADISRFLPKQTPWLQGFSWDSRPTEAPGLASKETAISRGLDECRMLNTVLKEELQKLAQHAGRAGDGAVDHGHCGPLQA